MKSTKRGEKRTKSILYSIVIAMLFIFILFVPVSIALYRVVENQALYPKLFEKYGTYDLLGKSQADQIHSSIMDYFHNRASLNTSGLAQNEILHLRDIKSLFNEISLIVNCVLLFSFILLLSLFLFRKEKPLSALFKTLISAGIINITLIIFVSIFAFSGFENLHIIFNRIFFPQGNWAFPVDSTLNIIYSESFFYDMTFRVLVNTLVISIIFIAIGATGIIIRKKSKK